MSTETHYDNPDSSRTGRPKASRVTIRTTGGDPVASSNNEQTVVIELQEAPDNSSYEVDLTINTEEPSGWVHVTNDQSALELTGEKMPPFIMDPGGNDNTVMITYQGFSEPDGPLPVEFVTDPPGRE